MELEEEILIFARECEKKTGEYANKAELYAGKGNEELAQSYGDWAFAYSLFAIRLRNIVRQAKKKGSEYNGVEKP